MFFEILNLDLGPGLEKIRDSPPISYIILLLYIGNW